ncbi:MAG: phosphatidylinositol-3-phosphatase [Rhodospirillaceae bacterium]|jgi:hypothetical protein|nr:phosphatidylinositol-3-phosphatase [Rhodospirillaceae bacterium]
MNWRSYAHALVSAACILASNEIGIAIAAGQHWPAGLPVYDHIVIVVEENKDYDEIIGNPEAPYINKLKAEGASLSRMYGEEHVSEGNYFWLFSGSNQGVGFGNAMPSRPLTASNLGQQLIANGFSFKGYAESLPAIGSLAVYSPMTCTIYRTCLYARKHVPWASFANLPNGPTVGTSSNLRFIDFPAPADYDGLPTVAFVIPNLSNDMHDGSVRAGDQWLEAHLDAYYRWAKSHNSLLILTVDESHDRPGYNGFTDFRLHPGDELSKALQNRIATIFVGAHVKPGDYPEGDGVTHVNILRTIEAMYGLGKSGAQQPFAAAGGISDERIITDLFQPIR